MLRNRDLSIYQNNGDIDFRLFWPLIEQPYYTVNPREKLLDYTMGKLSVMV